MLSGVLRLIANRLLLSSPSSKACQKSGPFPPPELPGFIGRTSLSDSRSRRHPSGGVWGGNPRAIGPPPMCRVALSTCRAHYPGGSERVHISGFLPRSMQPSPLHRRVGIRIATFEACSGFTHVTARQLAQPPKATFVTGLQPTDYADKLPVSYSTKPATIEVEPSSTGNTPLRGTLCKIAPRGARNKRGIRAILRTRSPLRLLPEAVLHRAQTVLHVPVATAVRPIANPSVISCFTGLKWL